MAERTPLVMIGGQVRRLPAEDHLPRVHSAPNVLRNPFLRVNQRGGTRTPGVGVYGYDRWRGHANGLEQPVLAENLLPTTYTLSWGGGGNGSLDGSVYAPSPITKDLSATVNASNNVSVVLPSGFTWAKLERGDLVTDCDLPDEEAEKRACMAYFVEGVYAAAGGYASVASQTARCYANLTYPVPMIATPGMTLLTTIQTGNATNIAPFASNSKSAVIGATSQASGSMYWVAIFRLNAELP